MVSGIWEVFGGGKKEGGGHLAFTVHVCYVCKAVDQPFAILVECASTRQLFTQGAENQSIFLLSAGWTFVR